jgi:phosphoglycolate phosphatase
MNKLELRRTGVKTVLFDLDGTLTDPKEGITACIQHALSRLGRTPPSGDELTWCIGPPLTQSLEQLLAGAPPELAGEALTLYRERYAAQGIFEAQLYPGVAEMLDGLCTAGLQLLVATSKPLPFARTVLDHFRLTRFFTAIYGSEMDGIRSHKGELLAYLLEQQGLQPGDVAMVGDREHDMRGARQNGILPLGAGWGYGSLQELELAGAAQILPDPRAALHYLLRLKIAGSGAPPDPGTP